MWWDWNTWGWAGMAMMMSAMVVFWGGIIALVVWLVVRATRRGSAGSTGENHTALNIARQRYAKGEITKEQFEEMKKDLSG